MQFFRLLIKKRLGWEEAFPVGNTGSATGNKSNRAWKVIKFQLLSQTLYLPMVHKITGRKSNQMLCCIIHLGQWQFLYNDWQQLFKANVLHNMSSNFPFIWNLIETFFKNFSELGQPLGIKIFSFMSVLNYGTRMFGLPVQTSATWSFRSCPIAVTCNIIISYCPGVFNNIIGSVDKPMFSSKRYGTWNIRSSWNSPLAIYI